MKRRLKELTKDPVMAVALLVIGVFLFVWLRDGLVLLAISAAIVTAVGIGVYRAAKPALEVFEEGLGGDSK